MTDKQIIKTLRNIQKYCSRTACNNCKFCRPKYSVLCGIRMITLNLRMAPEEWDIDEIERLLKEYE